MAGPPAGFKIAESLIALPPEDAVMTAVCTAVTAAAVAVKEAKLEPAGTVTDAGTVKLELLEVRLTAVPPAGASPLKMSEHVLEPAGARLAGTHSSEFGTAAG